MILTLQFFLNQNFVLIYFFDQILFLRKIMKQFKIWNLYRVKKTILYNSLGLPFKLLKKNSFEKAFLLVCNKTTQLNLFLNHLINFKLSYILGFQLHGFPLSSYFLSTLSTFFDLKKNLNFIYIFNFLYFQLIFNLFFFFFKILFCFYKSLIWFQFK